MCGIQVWVRSGVSESEEELPSVTLWWDVLQTTGRGKEVDEAFSEKPEQVSVSQTPILTVNFNVSGCQPSRRLPESVKDNF